MAKIVSQETYDSVVLENIKEFDQPLEIAIAEADQEFEAQGVLLSNIVKNMQLSSDQEYLEHPILIALEKIKTNMAGTPTLAGLSEPLETFCNECKVSLPHRMLATKHQAFQILLELLKKIEGDTSLLEQTLAALVGFTESNPDVVTLEGAEEMLHLIDIWQCRFDDSKVPVYLACWSYESCLKHENNRQRMVELGAMHKLISLMQSHKANPKVVRACCRAIRVFTLDDDIRQEFGKAHDHARMLVEEHRLIKLCLEMLNDSMRQSDMTSELLSTVSKLCVRAEYCQETVDHGGLKVINNVLVSFPRHVLLSKQAISLLKVICGNDNVKEMAMKGGVSQLIVSALYTHQQNTSVCEECFGAITMLALREAAHSQQLARDGAAPAIMQAMKVNSGAKQLQKLGCMAVRNMVSRVPENRQLFLECGVEEVIRNTLKVFGEKDSMVMDIGKAALRDLDLQVELVEQWRGLGHEIERD